MERDSSQESGVPSGSSLRSSPGGQGSDGSIECVSCGYRLIAGVAVCSECATPRTASEGPQGLARLSPSAVTAAWWAGGLYAGAGVLTLVSAIGVMLERATAGGAGAMNPSTLAKWFELGLILVNEATSYSTIVLAVVLVCLHLSRRAVHWRDWSAWLWAWAFWPMVIGQIVLLVNVEHHLSMYFQWREVVIGTDWRQMVLSRGMHVIIWATGLVMLVRVVFLCNARVFLSGGVPPWTAGAGLASAIGLTGVFVLWMTEQSGTWSSAKLIAWQTLTGVVSLAQIVLGITLMRRAGVVVRQHDRWYEAGVGRGGG